MPQERGTPEQLGAVVSPAMLEAKTESFFCIFLDPQ
jgi:hypothetical protein